MLDELDENICPSLIICGKYESSIRKFMKQLENDCLGKRKNEYQKWINKNYPKDIICFGWDISNSKNLYILFGRYYWEKYKT